MEELWLYAFNDLRINNPNEHPVLVSDLPLNTKEKKEKIAEIFFEKFNTPSFFLANSAVLDLYSTGRLTGISIEIGESCCNVVPVYEGYPITHNIIQLDYSGRDLTNFMFQITDNGTILNEEFEKDLSIELKENGLNIAREIKEKCCSIAKHYGSEKNDRMSRLIYDPNGYDPYSIPICNEFQKKMS